MTTTEAPSRTELIGRVEKLIPVLQRNAQWGEENRRLHEESIEAIAASGVLRMRVPAKHGGYESDMRTTVDVIAEIAKGDSSAGWTAAVWAISTWMMALFPDEVQEEVFATPDVRISGILSPTAMAVPADGGVIVNGQWAFNSGAGQSQWNTNAAVLAGPDGPPQPVMVAIPLSDLEIVDDWHTSGLRATGSVTTVAKDVFVPTARVLAMGPVMQGVHEAQLNATSPVFRAPFMPTACATISAPVVGMAKAAQDAFFARLPGRKITYTDYANQNEAPITHLQVAGAAIRIDEAEFHAQRTADLLDDKGARGEQLSLVERARVRLDLGAACQRAEEAVHILNTASGGSSLYTDVPIQRIARDVQAVNKHAILHPNTNMELYGRIVCGLEPNTLYI
jgi:alkylation response protein AidB-like acyl-CoA dehydrogenase